VGLPAAALYSAAYGGYAGNLSAKNTLALLQNEEALLVDIRSQAEREAAGVPELKRAARVKAVAVPISGVPASLRSRVDSVGQLEQQITASRIVGLSALNAATTKVIIMDSSGGKSKAMARLVRELGVARPYVLNGGFKAFKREGLNTLPSVTKYDATQLQVLADDVAAASESLATRLKDPAFSAGAAASTAAAGVAVANYHYTLEFIGVFALLLTATRKLASYNSPAEFFEEVGEAVEKVQAVASSLQGAKRAPQAPRTAGSAPMANEEEQ